MEFSDTELDILIFGLEDHQGYLKMMERRENAQIGIAMRETSELLRRVKKERLLRMQAASDESLKNR